MCNAVEMFSQKGEQRLAIGRLDEVIRRPDCPGKKDVVGLHGTAVHDHGHLLVYRLGAHPTQHVEASFARHLQVSNDQRWHGINFAHGVKTVPGEPGDGFVTVVDDAQIKPARESFEGVLEEKDVIRVVFGVENDWRSDLFLLGSHTSSD